MSKREFSHSRPLESGSRAALSYLWASACDLRLLNFVTDTVLTGDYGMRVLQDALDGKDGYKEFDPVKLAKNEPGPRTQAFRDSRQEFIEMFLSRAVDNFQVYIVEIISEVLHKQPRILSSSKQELTLGYVLQFESIDSLIKDWIEGKVASLSYDGFGEGSTPKSRTVVKGLRTSGLALRLFAASLGCGTARCIRTHQPSRHRASRRSCGRPARA